MTDKLQSGDAKGKHVMFLMTSCMYLENHILKYI